MLRLSRLFALFALMLIPAGARAACELSMSLTCQNSVCAATTINSGTSACTGEFYLGFAAEEPNVGFHNFTSSLSTTECFDTSDFPPDPTSGPFDFCFADGSLAPAATITQSIGLVAVNGAPSSSINSASIVSFIGVFDPDSESEEDIANAFAISTGGTIPSCTPTASVPAIAQTGQSYNVTWSQVATVQTTFQVDESTSPDFTANLVSRTVQGNSTTFSHNVAVSTTYYYRVKANSCGDGGSSYSPTVAIVVQAAPPATGKTFDTVVPIGTTAPVQTKIFVPGPSSSTSFVATTDKPYLTVEPARGTITPSGITLTVTALPGDLPPGANTGTVFVTLGGSGKQGQIGASADPTTVTVPVSITLATPVSSGGKTAPPANALIIPIVTHVNGAALFSSDVRLTNAGGATSTYAVTFTPTRTDATKNSKATSLTLLAGQTIALNDIAKDFFGYGATGDPNDVGFGSLEIRPTTAAATTYASSRTYATTSAGTFGQYIPAIPLAQFAGPGLTPPIVGGGSSGSAILSLQQIAQSTKFRTNLGIVEGSGSPATGSIKVFDDNGTLLKTVPFSLMPGEHQQINSFLAANGITTLNDGRLEITVESSTGSVTAYASVLDNVTTDPLAVTPVQAAKVSATRYVLPGVADLNGASNFHSDVRIFNGGTSAATVALTYFPQGNTAGATTAAPITIQPNHVQAIDNILPTLFNVTNSGGSVLMTTTTPSSLVVSGRTYSIGANNGTFGQFIPGLSPTAGIGLGDKPLQVLQLEESVAFRSNVGLAELSGNPVKVRISAYVPDSKVTPILDVDLPANGFIQYGKLLASLLPGQTTYNGRVTVTVLSGSGRVTAYGSVIDNATSDPTYVPAQ